MLSYFWEKICVGKGSTLQSEQSTLQSKSILSWVFFKHTQKHTESQRVCHSKQMVLDECDGFMG